MPLQWFLKYRPKTLNEVENEEDAKKELVEWIESWLKGKPNYKAVLLYGPPGVGKTTLAEALARDYKLELFEMNASDSRNLNDIRTMAERASITGTIFGIKGKLILLDEVDGLNARADAGAIDAILELINKTKYPIILTANDPWDPSLRPLRNAVKMIELKRLTKYPLKRILKKICEAEKITCEDEALDFIIEQSEGDARYAINMLQGVAEGYGRVTLDMAKNLVRRKDRELDPFEALRGVFWAKYYWQAKSAVTDTQIDYELLMRWLDENIPLQYDNLEDVWRAYDALSRASLFLTRSKLVGWDLLSYTFDLMGPGIAFASLEKKKPTYKAKWVKYQFPQYIQQLAKTKEIRDALDTLLRKIGQAIHASKDKTLNDFLPAFIIYYRKYQEKLDKELELTEKEKDVIKLISSFYEGSKVEIEEPEKKEPSKRRTTSYRRKS
ncbi:replication factor C large subunit [Sulfurisphaera tokodaii]|uniref:Replication factor C large subunit n=2 Tax=Sulfurisphaera tokodaii TaxID=111955 RepID=RFCL_SULTO|nr:replication factor C large subunit [Sulfurisphaera tokodaii]Q975D4.2 RecName: Full=Replication factor C large subunit; Short=RFC large subunit; AltName: Full=Clamp loader large subunit [Sulfurisphaera tokodaii str. 7]BAK54296.1 replication factor C large subunit [Sulfurisphaera tokodaii str. 7]HII74834.1 replication factor C large subunit [Sulfurisphaera tokodaii]